MPFTFHPVSSPMQFRVPAGALWLLLPLLAVTPALPCGRLHAQDEAMVTLRGRVSAPDGAPVAGARVQVRAASAPPRASLSDENGHYRVAVPAGAGQAVVSAERQGYVGVTIMVALAGAEVVRDLQMTPAPVMLDAVRVETLRRTPQTAPLRRQTPGESGASETAVGTSRYAVDLGDLTALAALTPGVLGVGGDEGAFPAVSMAGQDPSQNRTTLDGAGYGSGQLPAEALGRADVITSAYDVTRGRFSGGQIAVTTRAGGEVWGGAIGVSLRSPLLQVQSPGGGGVDRRDTFGQVSAGGGGALVLGRLYGYAAATVSRRAAEAPFLDGGNSAALRTLALDADSVARFYEVLARTGLGSAGARSRTASSSGSALLRLDWLPGERHAVMARLDARGSRLEGVGASALSAAGSGGHIESADAGVLAQVVSRFPGVKSELRGYASMGSRRVDAGFPLPAAQVRVGGGTTDGSTLLRAGAPLLPGGDQDRTLLELSHDLSLALAGGGHELRAGAAIVRERARVSAGARSGGVFVFSSLDDLEAGRASSFTRTLQGDAHDGTAAQAAIYLGDLWQPRPGLSVTFGARLEHGWYPGEPEYASALAPLRAEGAGAPPASTQVTPRAGFTYRRGPDWTFRGGFGAFQGVVPVAAIARAMGETGGPSSIVQLVCTGAAAPVPQWERYAADPAALPDRCADGAETLASRVPGVTLFAPDFEAPRTWRGSIGGNRRLAGTHFLDFEGTVVLGSYPIARDRNLPAAPVLTLEEEGGRPFFAPAAAVDPRTGAVSAAGTGPLAGLGAVRVMDGGGRSSTVQLGAGMIGVTPWQGAYGLRYTWTSARDRTTGAGGLGGSAASTGGDPRASEWAAADLQRTHYFQGLLSHRLRAGVEMALVGHLVSGMPFSALVDGDVNGDGAPNDRAFVFDPASAGDPVAAEGMARLLESAPAAAAACLRRSLGAVAARNACRSPWAASLDLQANIRPGALGRSRRLVLRVSTQNLLSALDQLVHGASGSRGWGSYPWVDPVLLRVRGFDPAAGAFRYEVNPAFGQPLATREGLRRPFGIVVQGRVTVGADPAFQQLATAVRALQGARRSTGEIRRDLEAQLPNLPAAVLAEAQRGRLDPSPEQIARLRAAADSLAPRLDEVIGLLVAQLDEGANRFTPEVRSALERGAALVAEGVEAVRGVLTPRQWNRLPRALREPSAEPSVPGQRVILPAG